MTLSNKTWLVIVLVLVLVSIYQEHTRNSWENKYLRQIQVNDSLVARAIGRADLRGTAAQQHLDSAAYWQARYLQLDSLQHVTATAHDTSDAAYHHDYLANPSAARLRFLAKRFPDVYSQQGTRRTD